MTLAHRRAVRGVLGACLAVHFVALLPVAAELFSGAGMMPRSASPLARLFPNVLAWYDAPAFVVSFVSLGAAASVALAAGTHERLAAASAYYVFACLFGRNPLIQNPSLPYVGLLVLAFAVLPSPGRSRVCDARAEASWRAFLGVAWILLAAGYTYSGLTKLTSPSWVDGTAFLHRLENPLARPTALRELALSSPPALVALLTYGALGLEILFAPLALVRRARPVIWSAMVAMHLGLLVLVDFADLTAGMLVFHAATVEPAWLRGLVRLAQPAIIASPSTGKRCLPRSTSGR